MTSCPANIYLIGCLFYLQGRLKPGRMLLVDTLDKVFMKDEVIKSHLANLRPVGLWLQEVRNRIAYVLLTQTGKVEVIQSRNSFSKL